jgi:hypothetical protein
VPSGSLAFLQCVTLFRGEFFLLSAAGKLPIESRCDVYIKTLSDPDVLEEAKKGRMDVDPATGEEPETLVKEIFDSPPEVVERVKKFSLAERDRELVRV